MKSFHILTGELVRVIAENYDEAMEKLADGDYEEIECLSEVQDVYELEYGDDN